MHQQADESRQPHDRLTRAQIDKMVDDAARFEEADKVDRDRAVSRNELEGCLYGLTGQLGDEDGLEGRLVAEDHGALVEAVEEGIEWLEENPRAEAAGRGGGRASTPRSAGASKRRSRPCSRLPTGPRGRPMTRTCRTTSCRGVLAPARYVPNARNAGTPSLRLRVPAGPVPS